MPIASFDPAAPLGVVVAAVSPARELDDAYRTFYELLAARVSALIRNAMAFEAERKRAEALAEIDRVKTAFFSNVSHEFRTPLTLILGPTEDALARPGRSLQGEALEVVHRSALRLLRLVNSLLDFSRVEAGRMDARFEATDLAALTADWRARSAFARRIRRARAGGGLPPLDAPVYVDRSHWEKIVLNLVSNAFKLRSRGRSRSCCAHALAVELSVIDTDRIPKPTCPGCSSASIASRTRAAEAPRARDRPGAGRGTREAARRRGPRDSGSARAPRSSYDPQGKRSSRARQARRARSDHVVRGRSSNAYVLEATHWGASSAADDVAAPGDAASLSAGASTKAPGARILVADDNADMRQYLTRLLSPSWAIEAVADGEAALALALRAPPDLVLGDVMMPRMDGVSLLRALRADPRTRTLPVILLSARAGEQAISSGLETGADDYVLKPFSARELVSRIRTHLEMARVRTGRGGTRLAERAPRTSRAVREQGAVE
jgi:CheY-like chemotaxis protein